MGRAFPLAMEIQGPKPARTMRQGGEIGGGNLHDSQDLHLPDILPCCREEILGDLEAAQEL